MLLGYLYWCGASNIEEFETAIAPGTEQLIRVDRIDADIILSIKSDLICKHTHVSFVNLKFDY
jgi:hypothetical protein